MSIDNTDDAPYIREVNVMLTEAIRKGASAIHIEPAENKTHYRHTIDGVLEPPQETVTQIIQRIKVMAKLDLTETQIQQEGQISLMVAGQPYEVRVSILSSMYGERAVMRFL